MARGYDSAGIGYTEEEQVTAKTGVSTLGVGVVGGATKGPLTLTECSLTELINTFGYPVEDDLGLSSALLVAKNTNKVLFQRVVSASAAKGVAGDEATDYFVFKTQTLDSTQNGNIVKLDYTATGVTVTVLKGTKVLEKFGEFSLDKDDASYLPELFNKKSALLECIRTEVAFPEDMTTLTSVSLTVRDGNDGIADLKPADYVGGEDALTLGVRAFANPEAVDIATLIVPGVFAEEVTSVAQEVATERGDCEYIIDPPLGISYKEANDFANATGEYATRTKLDNGFVGMYWPWVEGFNQYLGKKMFYPPSAWIASQYCYSDQKAKPWLAVAGEKRGYLAGANALECEVTKEMRDELYGGNNVVNPIVDFKTAGIVIWGNKTTRRTKLTEDTPPTSFMNIRRMSNYIRKILIQVSRSLLFDPNDEVMWNEWVLLVTPEIRRIADGRGIEKFKVVMDSTTVTEDDKKNGRAPGVVRVKPIRAAEWIDIKYTLTDNDIYFEEEV